MYCMNCQKDVVECSCPRRRQQWVAREELGGAWAEPMETTVDSVLDQDGGYRREILKHIQEHAKVLIDKAQSRGYSAACQLCREEG